MATSTKTQTTLDFAELGENITYAMDGATLIIKIDTSAEGHLSASGKTKVFASTRGNKQVGEIVLGVNAYRYANPK